MADFPAQQPAYMGEWTFINVTTPPPATQQLRLNDGGQNKATLIYVSNLTVNGINATDFLMGLIPGCILHIENKNDPTKWQNYAITGEPVAQSGYVQLAVNWLAGGTNLAQLNIMLSTIAVAVRPTGSAMTTSVGNPVIRISARVPVTSHALIAECASVAIIGRIYLPGQAFPSDTPLGFSGGMTLRQWYAGQALMGFIANSQRPAANLIGKVSEYSYKVADSMIAFEAKQAAGGTLPTVPRPPLPAPAAPPQSAPATVTEAQVAALRKKDAANAA